MPRKETDSRPRSGRCRAARAAALVVLLAACSEGERPDEVVVFAAASLRDVLTEVAPAYERSSGFRPVFNFAGSNVLARQIEAARVADLFLSADEQWMDYLSTRGRIVAGSRRALLSNRLLVIAHPGSEVQLETLSDLARAPFSHLVLADPEAVPAGRYARSALRSVRLDGDDLWTRLRPRVVPTSDVRAALALVEATPGTVGIVYGSDLAAGADVRRLLELAAEPTPILYVGAVVSGRPHPQRAASLLDFLSTPESHALFRRHGFEPLPEASGDG